METPQRYGIGLLIAALAGVASLLAAPDLPAEMAMQWDASGTAGNFVDREIGMALLPVLGVALLGLFAVLPRIDPLGENVQQFRAAYDWFAVLTVGFLAYTHAIVLAINLGTEFEVVQLLAPAMAVLYVAVGSLLERADRNWFVGIRTPWTLSDDAVWDRTHERAAGLFKLAGVATLGAVVLPEYGVYFLAGPVSAVALYATVFSYVDYRRRENAT
jgi:uncharacterized membrane protein